MTSDDDVLWSIQPFLADEDSNQYTDPTAIAAQQMLAEDTMRACGLADTHKMNWAFRTDVLLGGTEKRCRHLTKLTRFMSPLAALHRATGAAGALLAPSGPRLPYDGRLGVIEPGAFADSLVVDGDPSASLDWLGNTDNLRLIVKIGRVHKNSI